MNIVICFMRCQYPHIGHELILKKIASYNAVKQIYLSKTYDSRSGKNPLKYQEKLKIFKKTFPKYQDYIVQEHPGQIIPILREISKNYNNINLTFLCGSDRREGFEKLINTYNGVEYNFNSIEVISCGPRTSSDLIESSSGTKMREFVAQDDLESFKKYSPNQSVAEEVFKEIQEIVNARDIIKLDK